MSSARRLFFRHRRVTMMCAGLGLCLAAAPVAALVGPNPHVALASSGGNSNKGDVWVDNVGQPSGPGHEMDPHLACTNINLWGDKLADPSGTYTIDGWPPSGSQEQDYLASQPASWTYNQAIGGDQIIDVIDVGTLIANAQANGDVVHNKQGFHFKLQLSQDPQKHKTFWVDCTPKSPPPPATPNCYPTKSVAPAGSVAVGTELDYTVTASNDSSTGGQCVINDTLTTTGGATFAVLSGPTASTGTVTSTNLPNFTWTIPALGAGDSATLHLGVRALSVGTITNTAVVPSPQCTPTQVHPCSDPVSTPVYALMLSKSVSPSGSVLVNTVLTYTVTLKNLSTTTVPSVTVTDTMSGTAAFTVNDGTGGTANSFVGSPAATVSKVGSGQYRWTYAPLAAGATDTVTYTVVMRSPGNASTNLNGAFTLVNTAAAPQSNCAVPDVPACTTSNTSTNPTSGVLGISTTPSTGGFNAVGVAVGGLLALGGLGLVLLGFIVKRPEPSAHLRG